MENGRLQVDHAVSVVEVLVTLQYNVLVVRSGYTSAIKGWHVQTDEVMI